MEALCASDAVLAFFMVLANGVLQIPCFVVDKGLSRMRRCLVAQFMGVIPPIKVFQAVVARLWASDGPVRISTLFDRLFPIQFHSEAVSSWVLSKGSWHVHNSLWMSIFLLPKMVISAVERVCNDFLWGVNGIHRKKAKIA